jgi:hypothetical protein
MQGAYGLWRRHQLERAAHSEPLMLIVPQDDALVVPGRMALGRNPVARRCRGRGRCGAAPAAELEKTTFNGREVKLRRWGPDFRPTVEVLRTPRPT